MTVNVYSCKPCPPGGRGRTWEAGMAKRKVVALVLAAGWVAGAFAQTGQLAQELPLVSNAQAAAESVAARVDARPPEAQPKAPTRVEQIAVAAAARAALALVCEPARFEAVSRGVQRRMEAKVLLAADDGASALAYAKDLAKARYQAMALEHRGQQCLNPTPRSQNSQASRLHSYPCPRAMAMESFGSRPKPPKPSAD